MVFSILLMDEVCVSFYRIINLRMVIDTFILLHILYVYIHFGFLLFIDIEFLFLFSFSFLYNVLLYISKSFNTFVFFHTRSIFSDKTARNIFCFLVLNLFFAFLELAYGIWTNRYYLNYHMQMEFLNLYNTI